MGHCYLTLVLVASIVNLIILMSLFRKQTNIFIFFAFVGIVVSTYGHWLLGFSETLEGAIVANKVNYVGAAYIPMLMFFSLSQICKVKINSYVRFLMVLFSSLVLGLALTVGFSSVYYESFEFVVKNGLGDYVATYGWGHDVFNAMVVMYGVMDVVVVFYALFRRKMVSFKNIFAMFLTEMVMFSSFLVSRVLENDMLVMPIVYVLNQIIFLYLCANVKWYDIVGSVLETIEEDNDLAYISFSTKGLYLGCNDIAEKFFPKIKECRVDWPLSSGSELGRLFNQWLDRVKNSPALNSFEFSLGDRHYKCVVQRVMKITHELLFLFKIEDDTDIQLYIESLGKNNNLLQKMVQKNARTVQAIQEQMIVGMANMIESRDGNTGGHIKRTSQVVKILVDEMRKDKSLDLPDRFYDALVAAAPMHDLGKIAIDDQILRKPGKFSDEEFAVMKTHAEKGAFVVENLLAGIEEPFFVQLSKNVAFYHHERWDGKGYPKGLVGEQIPLEARIMAVADVYDALVSRRCYKERMAFQDAFDIIVSAMGTQFDPFMKKYFVDCSTLLQAYYVKVDH
ncbi:HD domain-containing phosphohydrolase [Fibrobacter sp.]|uniref:HD domain-containing phosphohydrolase n=1 Tax=Fibrobacter sp. TaxID=35828 RepID=UPI0038909103